MKKNSLLCTLNCGASFKADGIDATDGDMRTAMAGRTFLKIKEIKER